MTERELHALFSAMGPIDTCRVMRDFKVRDQAGQAATVHTAEIDFLFDEPIPLKCGFLKFCIIQ